MTNKRPPLTLPNLLLCEGADDVAFFQRLISSHNLPRFCIRDTAVERGGPGGNTRFGVALKALEFDFSVVRRILVASDNDDDPDASFSHLIDQLSEVFPRDKLPSVPLETRKVRNNIDLTILMIPKTGVPGNLETLCASAARRANTHMAGIVDQLSSNSEPPAWPSTIRRDEMWLRCNLAIRYRKNPFIPLGTALKEYVDFFQDTDRSFCDIIDILRSFG